MSTPHIGADRGDFAEDVIMPGDPLRAKRIADDWLEEARLVTSVRGILGYTGTYAGRPLSVMASGMGMPSATIYATELVREFGVRRIIRVGTAGGLAENVRLKDIVIATGAHTDSGMSAARLPGAHFSHVASYPLLRGAVDAAENAEWVGEVTVHTGLVFSTDSFYLARPQLNEALLEAGTLAVEMEAAGLYAVAAAERCQALAVVTIADHLGTNEQLTSLERERDFGRALEIALGALS